MCPIEILVDLDCVKPSVNSNHYQQPNDADRVGSSHSLWFPNPYSECSKSYGYVGMDLVMAETTGY